MLSSWSEMPSVIIRVAREEDYSKIDSLLRQAFGQAEESRLVEAMRDDPSFIPELSLVAETEEEGEQLGYVLFTRIGMKGRTSPFDMLALAPMAVLPEYQNLGIGGALVRAGLDRAKALGFTLVFVLGHPNYYPRFGFQRAAAFGVTCPFPAPDEAWMALELKNGTLKDVKGQVEFATPFYRL